MKEPSGAAAGGAGDVYTIAQELVSIGDDYWIEKGGQRVFKVDGKAISLRGTLVLQDPQGREVATIKKKLVSLRNTMTIERGGQDLGSIKRALFAPLLQKFTAEFADGRTYEISGDITAHQYHFERDGQQVAEVSKKWIALRDSYGIRVAPGEDDAMILSCVIAIDQMNEPDPD